MPQHAKTRDRRIYQRQHRETDLDCRLGTHMPLKDFVVATPRQLPVLILADVSGSMIHESKIETLNRSISEMLRSFKELVETDYEITVGVVTFGGFEARLHHPLAPVAGYEWRDMPAEGRTPLGHALTLAHDVLEDRAQVPSRSGKPVVVLASDGIPTDEWEEPLQRLLLSPRAGRATRFSVAIGNDIDEQAMHVLERFAKDGAEGVIRAENAHRIVEFFSWLTMSISQQAVSGQADFQPPPLTGRAADVVVE
ncbi:VWA domain-containing protein [Nonomuraea sp. NPDC048901]|uniref:vWA domain-containing protein n=1 Tax=Nonomuraea sp. NPDC048901 TaxID=3155627 RepID=UPI0033E8EF26